MSDLGMCSPSSEGSSGAVAWEEGRVKGCCSFRVFSDSFLMLSLNVDSRAHMDTLEKDFEMKRVHVHSSWTLI